MMATRQGGNGVEPNSLRRITRVEILGKLDVQGIEMPLKHGHFDGTNYSNGVAVLDDLQFHWAVTEGEDGKRIGTRGAPVNTQSAPRPTAVTAELGWSKSLRASPIPEATRGWWRCWCGQPTAVFRPWLRVEACHVLRVNDRPDERCVDNRRRRFGRSRGADSISATRPQVSSPAGCP
jgi:hypothetical protein